jgi:hypothetical protein
MEAEIFRTCQTNWEPETLKTAVEKTKWLLLTKPLAKKLEQQ